MALVAYGYSDSEEEIDEDIEEQKDVNVVINTGKVTLNEDIIEGSPELFSSLPIPKSVAVSTILEENDEFLKKTVSTSENKKKKRTAVKITVPALAEYNSDEDDVPKKIFKPTIESKSTGLFSVLPPPKAAKISTTKFVPHSVVKKPIKPQKKSVEETASVDDLSTDNTDDDIKTPGLHFFSSIFTDKIESSEIPKPSQIDIKVDSARPVQDSVIKNNKYFADMVTNNANIPDISIEPEEIMEEDIMKEAYTELVGRSRKAKGKKNKKQEMDIIDINATDIMPDKRDWMTKTLTEEQPASAVKKGDEPSLQHRRKHQITYLAYQAKLNEQDLKNQWAMNRMSRKQTQAKYGF